MPKSSFYKLARVNTNGCFADYKRSAGAAWRRKFGIIDAVCFAYFSNSEAKNPFYALNELTNEVISKVTFINEKDGVKFLYKCLTLNRFHTNEKSYLKTINLWIKWENSIGKSNIVLVTGDSWRFRSVQRLFWARIIFLWSFIRRESWWGLFLSKDFKTTQTNHGEYIEEFVLPS